MRRGTQAAVEGDVGAELTHIPYCGLPPAPGGALLAWKLDPIVIGLFISLAVAYGRGAAAAGLSPLQRRLFWAGWALTGFALICPLCPISVSLFSARVGQHMILTLVAAPMVAAGRPFRALSALAGRPAPERSARSAAFVLPATGMFALALWYWHTPGPYGATFASTAVYWTMHVTLYGSALWLWSTLLASHRSHPVRALASGLISTVQMGFLGAVITLAPHAMYAPHFLTTIAWGLTPLQDQQLGGVIMWVPGCVVFLAVALWGVAPLMSERPARRAAPLEPAAS